MAASALCPTDFPLPPAPRAPIAPLPPAMWMRTRHALASPILWRWIVLSMLLHVLAILLFGSPVGGNPEGRAMFGRLSVVIKEGWRDTGPDLKVERELAPVPVTRPPAPSERRGEGPRPAPKAPPAPPVELPMSRELSPVPAPVAPAEAPVPPVPSPVPPLLERLPSTAPKAELAPAPRAPPPVEAPPAPVAPPAIERITAPRVERPLLEAPPTPPATLERMTAPRVERTLIEAPPTPPATLEPMTAPRVERTLIEAPPTPPATLERMTAPRVERTLIEAPPTPPATLERLNAPRIERQLVEPPPMPAPREIAPPGATRPAETPAPSPRAAPSDALPRERGAIPGAPSRDREADSPFRKAPAPSSTYDPTAAPPALDLDAMRRRAGELGRSGTGNRAALPFPMPPVPEKKSKMEELIEKARKPDCREAYKSLGLAAVVPLIANEFGEGKCRW